MIDARDGGELEYIAYYAEQELYVVGTHSPPAPEYWLTPKGWAYLAGPSGGGAVPGRCFVAMSFTVDGSVYFDGIKPAVIECGYSPISMKDVLMNEDICHRMLAEIRKAEIVVADFTELKGGVYFESGFARALGREVFWTCREEDMAKIHFDTNHYQHLTWRTPEELRAKLSEKIMAIVGPGPGPRSA